MKQSIVALFLILGYSINAQQITCSPEDKSLFEVKLLDLMKTKGSNIGDTIAMVGQSFLGTPYVEKTLEVGDTETLVVNFGGLDCTTFVENVLAFSLMLQNQQKGLLTKHKLSQKLCEKAWQEDVLQIRSSKVIESFMVNDSNRTKGL